ncbi:acyl-protein synthetase [Palleronia caenipelagi]|uniref:Acyl-protein synthetase n=2 Tax=Palleronia caenipelagi TaxID=2489174 RepID=A0A547PMS8_9RHOB|nr:acyl-protein synthetase [Palleronia caenipelagi]
MFEISVYGLPQPEKEKLLLKRLNHLTEHHVENSGAYAKIIRARGVSAEAASLDEVPFLPVRLFKTHLLSSIPEEERFKLLTSSGTTGQQVSQIVLNRKTAEYQSRAVIKIMQDYLGKQRIPMLIIDHPKVVKDRSSFSARGAGILGMMNFGRKPVYALKDETMEIDWSAIDTFVDKHQDEPIFLFGFTFMVWKYFVTVLEQQSHKINLPHGILVHSGGWKKLQDEAVGNEIFKERVEAVSGIRRIHNFYGMVEQVGSIFVECEHGRLHAPSFADVNIRNPYDWSSAGIGQKGIIEVLSALPESYPGHALLTEDEGKITGIDSCPCGRMGKTFEVIGRLPKAELRGCSDTFQDKGR